MDLAGLLVGANGGGGVGSSANSGVTFGSGDTSNQTLWIVGIAAAVVVLVVAVFALRR